MTPEDLTDAQVRQALAGTYQRLTTDELKFLNDLRNRGFAVCVFTPQELAEGRITHKAMEEILVESGNEVLVDINAVTWRNPEDHKEV
jgi:hypothetical protein